MNQINPTSDGVPLQLSIHPKPPFWRRVMYWFQRPKMSRSNLVEAMILNNDLQDQMYNIYLDNLDYSIYPIIKVNDFYTESVANYATRIEGKDI